jgi:DNA gyrase subunit A
MVVTVSHLGYVKRTPVSDYRAQRRGGKGRIGMEARDEDWVARLFVASTHAYVFFLSDKGKAYVKKVHEIPEGVRTAKGRAIVNFVGMEPGERVAAITEVPAIEAGSFLVTITKLGQIKKTSLDEYENYREKGIIGVKIEEGDELLRAVLTDGSKEIVIATRGGMSIRFPEEQVRPTGRATMGVKGIELDEGDHVVGLEAVGGEEERILAVCERGYGKRTVISEFRKQSRGGKGVILIDASERNGPVVGIASVGPEHEVLLVTDRGQLIRTKASEIRETGRNAQGVRLMNVEDGERVVGIEVFEAQFGEEGTVATNPPPPSDPSGLSTHEAAPASDPPASDPTPSADGTTNGAGTDAPDGTGEPPN